MRATIENYRSGPEWTAGTESDARFEPAAATTGRTVDVDWRTDNEGLAPFVRR